MAEAECQSIKNYSSSENCAFAKNNSNCHFNDGYVEYFIILQCLPNEFQLLFLFALLIWWITLIGAMAITADNFFCPCLEIISKAMKLSQNLAGVTLLAFGNGSPDIFSAIASVDSIRESGDGAGLVFGALLGAGIFVTTVVIGSIAIVKPFKSMERPVLKDMVFYLVAIFWIFKIIYNQMINLIDSIGFIALYLCYVVITIVSRKIYQWNKDKQHKLDESSCLINSEQLGKNAFNNENTHKNLTSYEHAYDGQQLPFICNEINSNDCVQNVENEKVAEELTNHSPWYEVYHSLIGNEFQDFQQKSNLSRFFTFLKLPIIIIIGITCPVVSVYCPKNGWVKYLNVFHCVSAPTFWLLVTGVAFININEQFPVGVIGLLICLPISVLVFKTSSTKEAPKYHIIFSGVSFITSVLWIYGLANEVVNILETVGYYLDISDSILGLTVLAWANSLGDLVSDVTIAKQGYPGMGFTACIGGPLFNLLLGIGIPFTLRMAKNEGKTIAFKRDLVSLTLSIFLMASLLSSLIWMVCRRFRLSKAYGIYLMIFYVIFLIVIILEHVPTVMKLFPASN